MLVRMGVERGTSLRGRPWQGYVMVPVDAASHRHVLGGEQGAGARCPACDKLLVQLALLDATDERLDVEAFAPEVPLLYCWTCATESIRYRIETSGKVVVLEHRGAPEAGFPYPGYPASFPAVPVELVPLTADQQVVIRLEHLGLLDSSRQVLPPWYRRREPPPVRLPSGRRIERGTWAKEFPECYLLQHQVGGEPTLIQRSIDAPVCPCCSQRTVLFASIAPGHPSGQRFVDGDFQAIFFLCRVCRVVAAYADTD